MTGVALAVGLFTGFGLGVVVSNIRDIKLMRECDRMLARAEKAIKEAEE